MARGDGIDRIVARNTGLTSANISNTQRHNEREKDVYANVDIVPERTKMNIHFKSPTGNYSEMFSQMEEEKLISTRGLKPDAKKYAEMIIDVNSAYFYNHGGYEYAKKFYEDAYKSCVKIIGGEEFVLSAVMHADERNSAMSKELNEDIYHYHLHVVYIPVVEKEIRFSKRCKDKSLIGTVKEKITQVSFSKKWESFPEIDEHGNEKKSKNGKTIYRKSYSVLQDDIFELMRQKGYDDFERGEKFSTEENLSVIRFKVNQEEKKLEKLQSQNKKLEEKNKAEQKKFDNISALVKTANQDVRDEFPYADELLPEPKTFDTANVYRRKLIPIISEFIEKARNVFIDNINLKAKNQRLKAEIDKKSETINRKDKRIVELEERNNSLQQTVNKFEKLIQLYGKDMINRLLQKNVEQKPEPVREIKQTEHRIRKRNDIEL